MARPDRGPQRPASLSGHISFKNLGSLAHSTAKAGILAMTQALTSSSMVV
jgi:hypothetical protein